MAQPVLSLVHVHVPEIALRITREDIMTRPVLPLLHVHVPEIALTITREDIK